MIKINEFVFPTGINELTLEQFEGVSKIFNDTEKSEIDKYISIMELLGANETFINDLSDDNLFKFIKGFNTDDNLKKKKIKNFKIGDRQFVSHTDKEFVLKAKDLSMIEKLIKDGNNIFSKMIAVIFKEVGTLPKDTYDKDKVLEKVELFKDLNAGLYFPYIVYISEKINKKLTSING